MAAQLDLQRESLIRAAQQAEADHHFEVAADLWLKVRSEFPGLPEGFLAGAKCLRQLDRLSEAAAVLDSGIERFPNDEFIAEEHAWMAFFQQDFVEAVRLCSEVCERFPDNLGGYLAGGLASRRLGRFDQAEEIYAEALRRFPDNVQLHLNYAWCAQEQGPTVEALRRWEDIRERFPDVPEGHARCGELLMQLGRMDEAEAVLSQANSRFPDDHDVMSAYARLAHARRDWPQALRHWEALVTRFDDQREPRRMAAEALNEMGRYGEAIQVLAPVLRMYPEDEKIATLNAWLHSRRRDVEAAERSWREVRVRFPDNPDGYLGFAWVLKQVRRLDDADAVLEEALQVFPRDFATLSEYARVAEAKPDWAFAAQRWRSAVSACPQEPWGYVHLCECLLKSGELMEAKAVHRAAVASFPDDVNVASIEASIAAKAADSPTALAVWTQLLARFPDEVGVYAGQGRALRECGQLEPSERALSLALDRFPGRFELELELALTLSVQRQWRKVLPLWASLKTRYPGNAAVQWAIDYVLDPALLDQATLGNESFVIPPILRTSTRDESLHARECTSLLDRFESLGDSCELALLQRLYNVNNVSLLRWADTPPAALVAALNDDLGGVGDARYTIVTVKGNEYLTADTRYSMSSHTFTLASAEPIETFSAEQCGRIQWLRERLIEGLKSADKIFVYAYKEGISDTHVVQLHEALCRYSPKNILVCMRLEDAAHAAGSVEQVREGLFMGYLDRFSTIDIPVDAWLSVCREVASRLTLKGLSAASA